MDIYAECGHKVVFTGEGGYDKQREFANHYLEVGKVYTVIKTEVHGWHTDVYLDGFFVAFNSVMFEDYVEGA